jgi:hypothetical protein
MVGYDPNFKQSRIDVLYVYERLNSIISLSAKNKDTAFQQSKRIKEFMDECNHNFRVDTGLTIQEAQKMNKDS